MHAFVSTAWPAAGWVLFLPQALHVNATSVSGRSGFADFSASLATLPLLVFVALAVVFLHMQVRRRMMMTSGYAVKYNDAFHCFAEVIKLEGLPSLFKGAGANIVRVRCFCPEALAPQSQTVAKIFT
eukprot:1161338-Pelagomonas_calceolata.AAC.3